MPDFYTFIVVESEMIYEPDSDTLYHVTENVLEYSSDLASAVEIVDELNEMNPMRVYYVEQIASDETTTQIYGYNFSMMNTRLFKTRISPLREC